MAIAKTISYGFLSKEFVNKKIWNNLFILTIASSHIFVLTTLNDVSFFEESLSLLKKKMFIEKAKEFRLFFCVGSIRVIYDHACCSVGAIKVKIMVVNSIKHI